LTHWFAAFKSKPSCDVWSLTTDKLAQAAHARAMEHIFPDGHALQVASCDNEVEVQEEAKRVGSNAAACYGKAKPESVFGGGAALPGMRRRSLCFPLDFDQFAECALVADENSASMDTPGDGLATSATSATSLPSAWGVKKRSGLTSAVVPIRVCGVRADEDVVEAQASALPTPRARPDRNGVDRCNHFGSVVDDGTHTCTGCRRTHSSNRFKYVHGQETRGNRDWRFLAGHLLCHCCIVAFVNYGTLKRKGTSVQHGESTTCRKRIRTAA
jgi:hypothetical protein